MKNLKRLMFTVIALIAIGFADVKAQETVILRAIESSMVGARIATVTPGGEIIEIPLKKGFITKVLEENSVLIQREVDKWKSEGFKIASVNTTNVNDVVLTVFVLEK